MCCARSIVSMKFLIANYRISPRSFVDADVRMGSLLRDKGLYCPPRRTARVSGFSYAGSLSSTCEGEATLKSARAAGGSTGESGLRSQLFWDGHSAGPLLQGKALSPSSVAPSKPTLCRRAGHSLSLKIFHYTNILEKVAWNKGRQPPLTRHAEM